MGLPALTGNELLDVQGVQSNGQPSPTTFKTSTGLIAGLASKNPLAPVAVGAAATATIGQKYLLNTAAGSVLTLPAATGTGGSISVYVSTTVTSNSHKIKAASTADFLQGTVETEDGGTMTGWNSAIAAANCELALNGSTTGGFQGDWFELTDIAANAWQVKGVTKSTGTAATPFSTSDA
jgi:hypothetical protein